MAVFFSRFPRQTVGDDELTATEARQGRWGRHMFWVLAASTVLAVLVLFGSWAMRANDLSAANEIARPTPAEAQATTGPGGPVRE
jgi:hypothetical protein